MTKKKFKKALLEAANWQNQLTEFEKSTITFEQAKTEVINRIFEKYNNKITNTKKSKLC